MVNEASILGNVWRTVWPICIWMLGFTERVKLCAGTYWSTLITFLSFKRSPVIISFETLPRIPQEAIFSIIRSWSLIL